MTHLIPEPMARMLIVDDDAILGAIISKVSVQAGYEVIWVPSFELAIDRIAAQPFNCITVDLVLGDRDGIELLRAISKLALVPQVIVISGCADRILSSTIRMARVLGIADAKSFPKPLNIADFKNALASPLKCGKRSAVGPRASIQLSARDMERALNAHEVYAAFQPKIQIASGRVVGCEALARWQSPEFGQVGPDLFIPAMERFNYIKALTLELLNDSLLLAKEFIRQDPEFVVAVNLSANLLSDVYLPEDICALLQWHDVSAASLMLEVTESVAMADVPRAMDILLRLRIKGIGISMDDFGTGYSSLAVLARMPFSEIKIDRSFVTNCLKDEDMWKIVRGTVALGHEFNMKVVAEGIEDQQTLRALDAIGCDVGQGYYFSPALSADEFAAWYQKRNHGLPESKQILSA